MGTPRARALVATYLEYVLTHLRWVPCPLPAAWQLDLFEQPGEMRVVRILLGRRRPSAASMCPVLSRNPSTALGHRAVASAA